MTGIGQEPWHFRYVGVPHAEIMTEKGMVLEEYIEFLRGYEYGKIHTVTAVREKNMDFLSECRSVRADLSGCRPQNTASDFR